MINEEFRNLKMVNDFEKKKKRYQEIERVCREEWCISATTDVSKQTQYDSYISNIYKLLISNESRNEIFYYLWCLETEQMGLIGDATRIEGFIEKLSGIFSDPLMNRIKLKLIDLAQVFLDVIQKRISFEEASNWAFKMMDMDESGSLEFDRNENRSKIFEGLSFLSGVDLQTDPETYLHTMYNVEMKFKFLFEKFR